MNDKTDYKNTLNLPRTDFPMKANLGVREPEQLKVWEEAKIYQEIVKKNKDKDSFILHDGPPYANGDIHMGTALNKILKDIVVKYKNMLGKYSPYIPGWDCHGLPIELQVEKKHGKSSNTLEILKNCRSYAHTFIEKQKTTFKRLGVFGDWENPYLTMNPSYEASILREFSKVVQSGSLYSALKPVYWCSDCRTALAEAEVEYKNHKSNSIYVKFKANNELKEKLNLKEELYFVIWTTTPWTIPANLAICLHPDFEYSVLKTNSNQAWIIAKDLISNFSKELAISQDSFKELDVKKGSFFENQTAKHPFLDKESRLILGEHVSLEAGTGCVHTAPGHGLEDYIVGKKYDLDIYNPVDSAGKFYPEVPIVGGEHTSNANKIIIELLEKNSLLVKKENIEHSYPHCWRCKHPILFRATAQWFIAMDSNNLRTKCLEEIQKTNWVPKRGMNRIYSMIEQRPDWCVSRQRKWGVPIVYFICRDCEEIIIDSRIIDHVANLVEKEGVELWHKSNIEELFPKELKAECKKCGSKNLDKSKDILDVWFDSGVSHSAVCGKREELSWPPDLYLEGSDQHRGWFHTSLLTSVLNKGKAPYKDVVTHGFVVDKKGIKMSKSMGNVVSPIDLIKNSGADILRLWASHENFIDDISYSEESYKRVMESYRRIRNTFRFILGNISDFEPNKEMLKYDNLRSLDKLLLYKLNNLVKDISLNYETYEFYKIFQLINNFCISDLSSLYLDIAKDTLYVSKNKSKERKSIQTCIYITLDTLVKLLAPIMPFTCEEAFNYLPQLKPDSSKKAKSVFLEDFPKFNSTFVNEDVYLKWDRVFTIRAEVTKHLEELRKEKVIGHSLDSDLTLHLDEGTYKIFNDLDIDIASIFIVSNVKLIKDKEFKMSANKSKYSKCSRCWQYKESVGSLEENKELCSRCLKAIS